MATKAYDAQFESEHNIAQSIFQGNLGTLLNEFGLERDAMGNRTAW